MKTLIYLLSILLLLVSMTFSQTIDGRLVKDNNVTGSNFSVILQVKLADGETQILGKATNLKFDYDTLALQFVSGVYLNFNEANGYITQPISNPGGSHVISFGNNFSTELNSGNGQQVTDSWIDFAIINFTILDFSLETYVCPHDNGGPGAGFHFYSPNTSQDWTIGLWECFEGNVPVELTSFTANVINNNVVLNWTTATELNNNGFNILRNGEMIGFVPGFGTTTETKHYTFSDRITSSGLYSYQLQQVDFDGTSTLSDEVSINIVLNKFELNQNYPNPFNPSTIISFYLNKTENIRLSVYDILGNEVAVVIDGVRNEGYNEVSFNANSLSSGMYIYRLETDSDILTKQMLLIK